MIAFGTLRLRNFKLFREAELSLRARGLVLVRAENRDDPSADSNGSGKTTILSDGPSWVLHGKTVAGDEVLRDDELACEASLEIFKGDTRYEVIRARARKSKKVTDPRTADKLTLLRNGDDISGATMDDTQAEIERILGLDFLAFRNTVLCGQNDLAHFAAPGVTDSVQKGILKRLLRLEQIDVGKERVTARAEAMAKKETAAETALRVAEGVLAALPEPAQLSSRIDELKLQVLRRVEVEKSIRIYEKRVADVRELLDDYKMVREKLAALERQKAEAVAKVAAVLAQAETKAAVLRSDAAARERDVKRLRAEVARFFEHNECPLCHSPADSGHVADHVGQMSKEADEAQRMADESRSAAEELLREARAQDNRSELAKKFDAQEKKLRELLEGERDDADLERQQLRLLEQARAEVRTMQRADEERIRLEGELSSLEEKRKKAQETIAQKKEELQDCHWKLMHFDFCKKAFGNAGFPSFLLDSVMPRLTAQTNHYLSILSDGYLSVLFDTQSQLKSGESRDKISTRTAIGGRVVGTSGGQGKKLAIATRLALLDIACAREGSGVDLLLLDEVLDGLDATGRSRIEILLQELRRNRASIFVITHENSLTEIFESAITVVMENGVARIES